VNSSLRIVYAGTPDFSVTALQALIDSKHDVVAVYTQPDRPAGRGRGLQASPVKETALKSAIPVYQPVSFKDEKAVQELAALDADLMIVTAYGLLLPPDVLNIPRLGCINIHASLLPRWRGAAPVQRAILAGDKKTGITIMQMDEGLDTGDILAQAECEISADDTGSTLHDKLMLLGAETLMAALPAIAGQTGQRIRQDDAESCYAKKLSKSEAKVDWQQSAEEIARAIRAYNSWPVAYCKYEKNNKPSTLRLWQAESLPESKLGAEGGGGDEVSPGKVIAEHSHGDVHDKATGIDVLTGDGVLRIKQLQVEGKRKMSAADFLNANSLLGQQLK
jgi:methionyl-tRNA formyltransferase